MKKLSIEEKAKRYDEILAKAKRYYDEYKTRDNILYVEDMEDMFPELKESDDDRIRKWIIGILSTYEHDRDLRNAVIAYLEKQGEQKPTIEMITPEESLGIDSETYNKIVDECIYSEQKPAEWSEGDEKILQDLIDHFEYKKEFTEAEDFNILLWLKSPPPPPKGSILSQSKSGARKMKEILMMQFYLLKRELTVLIKIT